ncbi:MAG: hypothetical protein DMD29_06705 [Gemmatimonadetes bacterium]|nr:MAG: hypothetical protein DMD29_06705 [Gemmatimonadota bacterium]
MFRKASEPVILSAAGAKDLLFQILPSRTCRALAQIARVDQRLAEFETRLTKRLLNFWIAQAATTVALVFVVVKLVRG